MLDFKMRYNYWLAASPFTNDNKRLLSFVTVFLQIYTNSPKNIVEGEIISKNFIRRVNSHISF
jgi:hypothetical protein